MVKYPYNLWFKFFLCLFLYYFWTKSHSSLQCPLAEYYWSPVVNVPLHLSTSVDNSWLVDLWERPHWTFNGTFCCFLCEWVWKSACFHPYMCVSCHACSRLVKHRPWDLTFTHSHTPLFLQAWASKPPENADKTESSSPIPDPTSLYFPSVSDIERVVKAKHGRMDGVRTVWEMWDAVQRLVR